MNEKTPTLSAVIISWNRSHLLKQAIQSLHDQQYPNLEIIVVDNGSTDDSLDWLRANHDIHLIENKRNIGASAARNQGTRQANGDYIIYMDSDAAIITPHGLQRLVNYLKKNPDTAGIAGIYYTDPELTNLWCWSPCMDWEGNHDLPASLSPKPNPPVLSTCFAIFRHAVLKEIGGFDEFYPYLYEDADLSDRMRKCGYRLAVDPEVKILHHYAQPGRTKRGNIQYHYYHERLRTYFVLKNWGLKRFLQSWWSKVRRPRTYLQQFHYLPWICYIDIYWVRCLFLLGIFPWIRSRRAKRWI